MRQLAQLQTLLEQYIKQRTALRTQQEAFIHSGLPNPVLEQSLRKSLTHLDEQIQALEHQLDELANIQSFKGISKPMYTRRCLRFSVKGKASSVRLS